MIAIEEARRAGLLGRAHWTRNIVAGIVTGIVAIPLAMAFAVASGVKPEQGMYTAIVAGLAVAVFGGSRVQVAGPTGAFVVLLAGITARYGYAGLQIATLLAGAMLVAFGLLKLGRVIRFIPESVILGFTAGIAIVIWLGQWPAFFGLPAQTVDGIGGLTELVRALPQLDPATTMLGIACVVVIGVWPRIPVLSVVPAPLVALVGATAYVALADPASVATIGSAFGGVPRALPALVVPSLEPELFRELLRPAFSIALLGAIESLLSATVADGMSGTRHNANQELIGQGIANALSALFGGIAATGAVARTATSVRHGGTSPLAAIVHVVLLVAVLLVLAPLASFVPLAALAAILFVVALNMADLPHLWRAITRAPRTDVAIMLGTLALTVAVDIVLAVELGVIAAMVAFLYRMADTVDVSVKDASAPGHTEAPEGWLVYAIDGPFFYGAIEQFEHALATTHTEPETLVIDLSRVPFVDYSGLMALRETVERMRRRNVRVILCGANALVSAKIERDGLGSELPMSPSVSLEQALAPAA